MGIKTSSVDGRIIVREARKWLGTPYMHQASIKGQGADCLGLIRGIWRGIIGDEPEKLPAYSPDWGEITKEQLMLNTAHRHFVEVDVQKWFEPGNMLLFQWKNASIAKHVGIFAGHGRFIHAYEKAGVIETTLGNFWKRRIIAGFAFPAVQS